MTSTAKTLTRPGSLSFEEWTRFIVDDVQGDVPLYYSPGQNWREWGTRFVTFGPMAQYGAPLPNGFTDWHPWADAVVGAAGA